MLTHFPTVTQSIGFQPNPQPRVQLMVTQSIGLQPNPQPLILPTCAPRGGAHHQPSVISHQPSVTSHQLSLTSHQ
ncbi:MAG: hypothetical protein SOZ29_07835 [Prevotella sp.]|nr:hypothetical protein [Prevotella sp.]